MTHSLQTFMYVCMYVLQASHKHAFLSPIVKEIWSSQVQLLQQEAAVLEQMKGCLSPMMLALALYSSVYVRLSTL